MFVIKCTSGRFTGWYVTQGRQCSYTKFLQHARVFSSKAEAEANMCPENEIVLSIDSIFE
jgi:hypothetical protein